MIIFNNGQGGGGANQTADLALINNGVYGYEGFRYTGVSSIATVDMKIYTSNGVLYIISPIATDLHIVRADGISIAKTIQKDGLPLKPPCAILCGGVIDSPRWNQASS